MSLSWTPIAEVYNPLKAGSIDGTDVDPHDRAVIRALSAKYKANKSVDGDPLKTIFIARLDRETDEDTLWTAFRTFGKIKKCRLVRDIVTGFSKGYGFVEYEEEKSARAASRRGNKMTIGKVEVFVDLECERTLPGWIPRRFGGGVGGNKKSGQLRFGGKDRPFIRPILSSASGGKDFGRNQNDETRKQEQAPERDRYNMNRDDRSRNFNERDRNRDVDRMNRDRRSRDDRRRDVRHRDEEYRSERRDRRYRDRSRSQERERNRERDRGSRKPSPDFAADTDVNVWERTSSLDYPQDSYLRDIAIYREKRKDSPSFALSGDGEGPKKNPEEEESKNLMPGGTDTGADAEEGECVETQSELPTEKSVIKVEPDLS